MEPRTPITVITGPLGSGKTTLLRNMLQSVNRKIAIVMNELGEIAIDSKIVEGRSVRIAELGGGCVCCSLIGEFEEAVNEIIDTVRPEHIVLETTGVAEPGALVFDIQENLPRVRLDGVVSLMDADGMVQFPSLGHTTRLQIEEADLILLNKTDLVGEGEAAELKAKLRAINPDAPILPTCRSRVDMGIVFGLDRARAARPAEHVHQPGFEAFSYSTEGRLDRECFENFAGALAPDVYRAKGFVRFAKGCFLFNFVNGRWELEPFDRDETVLVFIGRELKKNQSGLLQRLKACESHPQ